MVYVCHILGIKNKSVEFGNQGGISMFLYRGKCKPENLFAQNPCYRKMIVLKFVHRVELN
jgi:hypothetical protein